MKKCIFTFEHEIPTWEEVYNSSCIEIKDDWDEGTLCCLMDDIGIEDRPIMIKENDKIIFKYYEDMATLTKEQWNDYMSGNVNSAVLVFDSPFTYKPHCQIRGIEIKNGETRDFWRNPFYRY